ncbi:Hypothetical predicted protein [Mytilus galloprovincialis]|uniref:Uncharacterized protein n=1 Tax=Mytilus galloprovincialis TaxID=29158 RepID=A0A8B6EGP2_MYTGA|nr:Hypothetical predicted protein [Mytilus galloprovincialis]
MLKLPALKVLQILRAPGVLDHIGKFAKQESSEQPLKDQQTHKTTIRAGSPNQSGSSQMASCMGNAWALWWAGAIITIMKSERKINEVSRCIQQGSILLAEQ